MKGQKSERERGVSPGAGKRAPRKRGRDAAGGPATARGAPTNGSHSTAARFDAGDDPILGSIPSFSPPVPVSDTPPSSPEVQEDPGEHLPIVEPPIRFGGSLPRRWDNVRLPALKNVGKDAEGKVIPHVRSEEVARVVAELAMGGTPENTICAILNIRPGQLRAHYYNELTYAPAIANARVASTAYAMAISGDDATMTKFVAKARLKWRDGETPGGDGSLFNNIHIHLGD